MARTKCITYVVIGVLFISTAGCASFNVGTDKNPPQIKSEGIFNGYMACNGIRPYDGNILEAGILSDNDRWGDIISLDFWPIGGIGVGLIGAKVKLLPFEIGFGILGHDPEPELYSKKHEPKEEDKTQE